jgi:cell division cycle 14
MGPVDYREEHQRSGFTPEEYSDIFKLWNVKKVIRLNEAKYDRRRFINQGVSHTDLFFVDGSNPSDEIANDFLKIVERHFESPNSGAISVHCKAGLGRTGTLIGLYAMKHYQIPAEQFIGWIRIARPGSILGPQQFYLC